jgi:hypothetical protein
MQTFVHLVQSDLGMMERALDLARSGNSNYKKGRDRKIAL